ncbi:S phase cyclin A-associated protein in the endoplasmic reticulum [Protopterus annectens]|uniref:S phase cyclin A-associated protein in the endoplasmic reticulum n=1 Tax=Protopterus annectens TaxID=7888 RepID=UPI001CFA1434|nr:S phase cyclin A-associated protein in the endoplasmic reticulum [Protopterus annectens]
MSKESRGDGRRRGGLGQHRMGSSVEMRDRAGMRSGPGGDGRDRSGSNSSGSSHGGAPYGKGKHGCGNAGPLKPSFQRSNSHDKVRRIVAEEGRTARNLIAWNVPLESKEEDGKGKQQSGGKPKSPRSAQGTLKMIKQNTTTEAKIEKSPTKSRQPRKVDLRARYWAFLFENLRRAVDEIYVTCESDQSVVECKEVLMMLDNYVRDFKALIDWIELQEKLEKTDAQNRPTSLAWEVRKMSPGRHVITSPSADRMNVTPSARRSLNFGGPPSTLPASRFSPAGGSWADKVKANQGVLSTSPSSEYSTVQSFSGSTAKGPSEKTGLKDAEGWETVQRGRPVRPRSATMINKSVASAVQISTKDDSDKENFQSGPMKTQQNSTRPVDIKIEDVENKSKKTTDLSESSTEVIQVDTWTQEDAVNLPLQKNTVYQSSVEVSLVAAESVCSAEIFKISVTPADCSEDQTVTEKTKMDNEIDASELSNSMAAVLAKNEELADRLEKANEEAIASAIAEEEQLNREIQAEENNDLNLEAEESLFSLQREKQQQASIGSGTMSFGGSHMDWSDLLADYEARESWRQSTSWGDIVEDEPSRPPGHGIHMHEKLSSPSRKRTLAESKKKHEEKQLKAQQLREKLREEKALKLQKLLEREKEVRKWKEELLEQRRKMMDEKLLHAEFKRELQLQAIVKKAQEEDAKVNEIAFINTLEAQNKRHDALSKLKEYETRLNELQEERLKRQEEKQARDEAVQERKRVLEAERQARVEELLMKRKEQEARIEQQRQEKEKAREDAARERARDREERLAALTAAQQEAMEELQKKIQLKHDESIRRHMEQIEQRKEKAAELSSGRHANPDYAPKLTPYERKKHCSLCSIQISSEVYLFSHIKGKKHQQAVRENSSIQGRELSDEEVEHLSLKKYIVDIVTDSTILPEAPKDEEEKQKARKKAKKLRTRMNARAKEYENSLDNKNQIPESPYKAKLQRIVKDLVKQIQVQDSGVWANNKISALDRTLGETCRILEKQNSADQIAFQAAGGLTALEQILQVVLAAGNPNAILRIPLKSLSNVVRVYHLSCNDCLEACLYMLFSNKLTFLMELLMHQLTLYVPDEDKTISGRSVNKQVFEGLTSGLLQISTAVFRCLTSYFPDGNNKLEMPNISKQDGKNKLSHMEIFNNRIQDLISYVVNLGLIDKLYSCFLSVQGPVDENSKLATFLQNATGLLYGICRLCYSVTCRTRSIFDNKRQDPAGLITVLKSSDLVGTLHMLYCILLHGTMTDPNPACPKEGFSNVTVQVAIQSVRFLNSFAVLDLLAFQSILGAEGLSLAFRHIVSSLLGYCSYNTCEDLLHEVIICIGYFTVNHSDNQMTVQSGRHPTVLQKLCQLPFQYFSDPRLIKVLFPALIAACYNNTQNKVILEQEMSCILLATFIQDCAQNTVQMDHKTSRPEENLNNLFDYLELANRFPREMWDDARQFFVKKEEDHET